jgi:hypothetical protein
MFSGSAVKSAGTAALGGAAAGLAVGLTDSLREKTMAAFPAWTFLGSVWARVITAGLSALAVSGLLRSRSTLAAAGASGAVGYDIAKLLVAEFAPVAFGKLRFGLSGSIAQGLGASSFLERLNKAGERLGGSIAEQRRQLAGSVAQSLGGTAYGGPPVSAARVGIRASRDVGAMG